MLNGANSQMVVRITEKSIREEASKKTRTFDVIASISCILLMDHKPQAPRSPKLCNVWTNTGKTQTSCVMYGRTQERR